MRQISSVLCSRVSSPVEKQQYLPNLLHRCSVNDLLICYQLYYGPISSDYNVQLQHLAQAQVLLFVKTGIEKCKLPCTMNQM